MKKRFLSALLYALPIIFFLISYLTMLTSGEDIFQGAATPPDLLGDSIAAFHHSARLADMYAWAIINFYTYSVSFGPDLFFRLLDVFAVFSLFYLCTFFVLRHRPRLKLKDALIFSSLFLLVLLTQNGRILYSGFSGIHNYLFISLSTLLFFLPIFRLLHPKKSPLLLAHPLLKNLLLFLLAFIFAFSSNVTAIIFLLALILFLILNFLLSKKFPKSFTPVKRNFQSYLLPTLPGLFLGLAIIYLVGDGLSDYSSDPTYLASYDYISFSALFSSPLPSAWSIIKHISWNLFRSFAPLTLFSLLFLSYLRLKNPLKTSPNSLSKTSASLFSVLKTLLKNFQTNSSRKSRTYLLALTVFTLTYLLSFSQLYLPTRLALPAYLTACIALLFFFQKSLPPIKKSPTSSPASSSSLASPSVPSLFPLSPFIFLNLTLCLALISVRTFFSLDYRSRAIPLLKEIRTSTSTELCFPPNQTVSKDLPILHLGQESFLQDWALPETIYGKKISYCTP